MKHSEWRRTIETQYDVCKVRAIKRAAEMIRSLPKDRVLEKFDLGARQHQGQDAIDPVAEFKDEMCDAICYEALSMMQE